MAAGRGTRNNNFSHLHKALLPLSNRPVISYILDCVNPEVEVVIALGHRANQLRSYLEFVYPNRNLTFVDVDKYEGAGSGPGYSLLQCKEHLQCPFVFTSIDTLFNANLMPPTENWVGVCCVDDPTGYCLVDVGPNKMVRKFYYDPTECLSRNAFIGIAGISDYEPFWSGLSQSNTVNNEHQVINGFTNLEMTTQHFKWYDTGTGSRYKETRKHFPQTITTAKDDEVLYIDHGKVVKFFSDVEKIKNRVGRARILGDIVPKVTEIDSHMYGYDYIVGDLLAHTYDERLLDKFIDFCSNFFKPSLKAVDLSLFRICCDKMYKVKTLERVAAISGTELDTIERVNGIEVLPIDQLLKMVNWRDIVEKSIPFVFHGDFQPENIVMDWDHIYLLDWRDSFGGNTHIGDLYYDLGKLHHALLVNGTNIVRGGYSVEVRGPDAFVEVDVKSNLLLLLKKMEAFCKEAGFDWDHVNLLGALQYVTIASLYTDNEKYRDFLFLFGKLRLTQCLGLEE